MNKTIRCAVYTRKSTQEGLEQEFNSLDAQREASLAYIKSQHHEGWRAIRKTYDDGGISGATLNRPGVQALLDDIKAGQIDTVVVYKVDRLTRSLADFSKLIELFDQHNVSFISVTQQFNTTSSMGRLTLNVLLSFAQFEREVTGERIRDKIAASKKKGMWMGGLPPIGYDVQDKKLVINEKEAETVKQIFDLYLRLGNVRLVKTECDRDGLRTKVRLHGGKIKGGTCFSRGHLYSVLNNPLYAGKVRYKDNIYDGQHDAIICPETWETVQRKLEEGAAHRTSNTNQKQVNLLTGFVYDEAGQHLKPNYTVKQSKRYRYYVSTGQGGWRIPAQTLEQAVEEIITNWLKDDKELYVIFEKYSDARTNSFDTVKRSALKLTDTVTKAALLEKASLFQKFIAKVELLNDEIKVKLNRKELYKMLDLDCQKEETGEICLTAEHQIKKRGVEKKIILMGDNSTNKDEKIIALIARSYQWLQELVGGQVASLSEIARRENIDIGDVSRFFQLAFLSPDIVVSIIEGKQPADLSVEKLKRVGTLPYCWSDECSIWF